MSFLHSNKIFRDSRGYIFQRPIVDDVRSVFNKAVIASAQMDTQHWWQQINEFFQEVAQTHSEKAYKFNFSFGFILQHVDTHYIAIMLPAKMSCIYPVIYWSDGLMTWGSDSLITLPLKISGSMCSMLDRRQNGYQNLSLTYPFICITSITRWGVVTNCPIT